MLYLGADHRGFKLKELLKAHLEAGGVEFKDLGASVLKKDDDFIDYALAVAKEVGKSSAEHLGIVICGSGAGVDMAANKVRGVRSSLMSSPDQAEHSREADALNVLALASDFTPEKVAVEIVDRWLRTPIGAEERYRRRLQKLADHEQKVFK